MIRLLIVDDSKTIQKFVAKALEPFSDIEIIDTAADPYDARKKIIAQKPDVITLDIEMPRMDGITFLKKIMQHYPLPVVIISSFIQTGSLLSIQALEMGAFEVIEKPENPEAFMQLGSNLAKTLRAAKHAHIQAMNLTVAKPGIKVIKTIASAKLLVMGGSTGGVEAFTYILRNFPASLLGTIIIQHMPDNFLPAFAERLDQLCPLEVKLAKDGEFIRPNCILVAPGNQHIVVKCVGGKYLVNFKKGPKVNYHCPSIDVLFKSVAASAGAKAVGVLLTGMGNDGARGLLAMKMAGAHTIVQDEKTSTVFGMPKAAIKLNAANAVAPLETIAYEITAEVVKRV